MAARFDVSNYKSPGPVATAFIKSDVWVPFIMGPVGSGKTNASFFKLLARAAAMPPCRDGVRRAKFAVVRTDYRTLYKTTLKTWFNWFPPDFPGSKFTGGSDRPAFHNLQFISPTGNKIELFMEFSALGENRIEDVMRGWEGTGMMLNEADLLVESTIDFGIQRSTRYPSFQDLGGFSLEPFVIGDLNPPGNPKHWIVERFLKPKMAQDGSGLTVGAARLRDELPEEFARLLKERPSWIYNHATPGHVLFQQPSGVSPQAENLENLSATYYVNQVATMSEWDVHRFVHGKIGYDRCGLPVYPEFDERVHISRAPLKPIPGVPLVLGLDISGLHPGAVILQRAANLQFRVLRELYLGRIGAARFAEHLASILESEFRDCSVDIGYYDPSNDYGADKEGGDLSAIDIIRAATGIRLLPAPSNEITLRVEAVRNLLTMSLDIDNRALLSCVKNTMLNDGFMSDYHYKLQRDGQPVNADRPKPEKNECANIHDALQYACLGLLGRAGTIAAAAKGARPGSMAAARSNVVLPLRVPL